MTLADSLSFDFLDISILIGSHRVSYISFLKRLLDLLLKCLVGYVAFCQLSLLREPNYQVSVRKVLILSLPSFIGLITKYNLDLTMRFLYETTSTDFHRLDMWHACHTKSPKIVLEQFFKYGGVDKTWTCTTESLVSEASVFTSYTTTPCLKIITLFVK